MLNMLEKAKMMKEDELIQGARRFQIIDAENGKIIRYTGIRSTEGLKHTNRTENVPYGEYYYLVKEGEDLLGALARILVVDKISQ